MLQDKQLVIPDESIGKDAQSISALQRRLASFEHDLVNLGLQVRGQVGFVFTKCLSLVVISFISS